MYHYVRNADPEFPYFRFLDLTDFSKQLEFFGNRYGFVSKAEFMACLSEGRSMPGVVLTFDDGFVDHYDHVLPVLSKNDLWGIFYVPTAPLTEGRILDVHRVHLLLGRYGGREIAAALGALVRPEYLVPRHVEEFKNTTYVKQDNEEGVDFVKRTVNYYLRSSLRTEVLDHLMEEYFADEKEIHDHFYMSPAQLTELVNEGMTVGSHSVSHPVMSGLAGPDQEVEINGSFDALGAIVGDLSPRTFCYPYGGAGTFTNETEALLEEAGCRFSFSVEPRDVTTDDLVNRVQALPRFDCNEFPHVARDPSPSRMV